MKNWAGFAGTWATAAAIALAMHAGGAGGLKWLGASHSAGIVGDFQRVAYSQALRVRIETSSPSKDLLGIPKVLPLVSTDRSVDTGRLRALAQMESSRADGLSPEADAIERNDSTDVTDVSDGIGASSAPNDMNAGPEGFERCTNLSSLIPRELWLEFRDYGILPRTYKVAYARHVTGDSQLVQFEPVNAQEFEYADRTLSSVLQRCMSDLRTLPSHGDFEVTFVIGDE